MSQTVDARHEPVAVIIFGGAGDLTWRKLIPSLFSLHLNGSLPDKFAIIGLDRAALSDATLRKRLHEGVRRFCNLGPIKSGNWKAFAAHISYHRWNWRICPTERDAVTKITWDRRD
jgi:glucose-6-phosphate 1-dehydrogenase